jgi:hypothetical protein
VGTGTVPISVRLSTILVDLSVDAHSGGSGHNPTGTVDFVIKITGGVLFSGPPTCLAVTGNTAVIGLEDTTGPVTFVIVDNHAAGTPDTVALVRDLPPCSLPDSLAPTPLVSGDFVVHDARPRLPLWDS